MKDLTLYRMYDADGALLYVGASTNLGSRLLAHGKTKPWWCDVASIKIERFQDRIEMLDAESNAIYNENPRYNILDSRDMRARRRPLDRPMRTRGTGSIFQRADGWWGASVELGYDRNGKRRRKTVYAKDRETAETNLSALRSIRKVAR